MQRKDDRKNSQITTSAITTNSQGDKLTHNQSHRKLSFGHDEKNLLRRDSRTLPLPAGGHGLQVFDNNKYISQNSLFEYDQISEASSTEIQASESKKDISNVLTPEPNAPSLARNSNKSMASNRILANGGKQRRPVEPSQFKKD